MLLFVLMFSGGCNSVIQLANGLGKDMQVAGAGVQAMTHKQRDIGAFSFNPPSDMQDSMILDHLPTQ